jgi:hypothetical protein
VKTFLIAPVVPSANRLPFAHKIDGGGKGMIAQSVPCQSCPRRPRLLKVAIGAGDPVVFRKYLAGDLLDSEVGTVIGQGIPNTPKLFTYARYNAELSREGLDALGLEHINPLHVQQMNSVNHIGEMQEIGQTLAQQKVKAEHFAGFPAAR